MMRPLLLNYTLNSDRQVQEAEPDGVINRLPSLAKSAGNEIGEQNDYTNDGFEQLLGI